MYKRKAEYSFESPSKKSCNESLWDPIRKLKPKTKQVGSIPVNNYVSGTGIKNYLLRDPILDWFDLYYFSHKASKSVITRSQQKKLEKDFEEQKSKLNVLFEGGNEFESKILEKLAHVFEGNMITINNEGKKGMTRKNFRLTVGAMMEGIPIIAQGVLFNDSNDTGGIADLLVRSDYLNKIFRRPIVSKEMETFRAPKLFSDSDNVSDENLLGYHYRVIDIKWTTMTLCANGYNIRNDGRFPSYKGQLAIYNCAMGNIQGFTPSEAYIMAKAWKIDRKNDPQEGFSCFDLLGVVDYNSFDAPYIEKTVNSIDWVRNVRAHGASWNLYKPTLEEMYPNASNHNDAPWSTYKKELCKDLDEITQIWYVSDQHRKNAHANGIMKWTDPECTSQTMGITGDAKPSTIDAILEINRDPNGTIYPRTIDNNLMNWQERSPCDFYVDFETVNCCFYNPEINIERSKTESDIVFMIGIGYIQDGTWNYKVLTAEDISIMEEDRLFEEFTSFITQKSLELDPNKEYVPRLFHWSMAEVNNFRHANNRHRGKWNDWEKEILWTDMYNVFTTEPIVVKGALNFKLKEIGRAMNKLGFVNTVWANTGPSDGFDAMLEAVIYYKHKSNATLTSELNNVYNEIIKYNEVDCKIIWEIVEHLRQHNCDSNVDFTFI
jgi:hypothetical protein